MSARHAIADVASLVAEPTRAAMLLALLDGRSLPAGELATVAHLSAAATSLHLAKLLQGGLVVVRSEGRHRYYRLANDDVAHALESLGVIATKPAPRSLSPEKAALRVARSCYDHLAGEIAVALADHLEREQLIRATGERAYEITPSGKSWLASAFEIDVEALAAARRGQARRCLDWTERRPHVAGALGAAMLARFVDERWVARVVGSRALRVTTRGSDAFARLGLRSDQSPRFGRAG